jgi:peptidoglycan/xylan/chitin deacetylase (PgdA/CDA1 family)
LLDWTEYGTELPAYPVVLTFDDNDICFYSNVYPILQTRGMVGVNFTYTDHVGMVVGWDHCDWDELQEMENAGVFFCESQTKSHPHLPGLSDADSWEEVNGSKQIIEANLNDKTCLYLAYPYCEYGTREMNYCSVAGYRAAFRCHSTPITRSSPVYELGRFAIVNSATLTDFKSRLGYVAPEPPPEPNPVVVDNLHEDFCTTGGWNFGNVVEVRFYRENYRYKAPGDGTARAEWRFQLVESGDYNIYAWWGWHANRASNAPFVMHHAGGTEVVRVNQQAGAGQWNLIGSFSFDAGEALIELADDADGHVVADAVAMSRIVSQLSDWLFYP